MKVVSPREMKRITVLILFSASFFIGKSQSFDPYVIGFAGTDASSGNAYMEWTIGEVMTKTYSSIGHFFTQGFHQPDDTAYVTVVSNPVSQNISIYPNPVADNLVIDFSYSAGNYSLEIIDMKGQPLRNEKISASETRLGISFHDFANGIYVLNIINTETQTRNSYKINKAE